MSRKLKKREAKKKKNEMNLSYGSFDERYSKPKL